jgi:prepilin-type N-terminal cleavage/methylation domain-containing protein
MTDPIRNRGFSLVEVLIATILVGLSIAALVAANGSFTMANDAGADLSTAEFLIEQMREMTTLLPVSDPASTTWMTFGPEETGVVNYDDLDDFDGIMLSPPRNANRDVLLSYPTFSQRITVQNLDPSNFDQVVADRTSDFVRITVTVLQNASPVSSASWVRARY